MKYILPDKSLKPNSLIPITPLGKTRYKRHGLAQAGPLSFINSSKWCAGMCRHGPPRYGPDYGTRYGPLYEPRHGPPDG